MKSLVISVAGAAIAATALFFLARRRNAPCPFWLRFLLENPYMNFLAGSSLLLERAAVGPGMRVLDAGCGPGRITIPAAGKVGRGGEVVALDLQPRMLAEVRRRAQEQGVKNVRVLEGGIGQGLLPREDFDRALLVTVLGEVRDKKEAMRELFSSLKPGGTLSITEVFPDPDYQTPRSVRRMAEGAGFLLTRRFGIGLAYTMNFSKPERG